MAKPVITKDAFAELMKREVVAAGGPTGGVYDPERFSLRIGDGIAYLHNVYRMYCEAPAKKRGSVLAKFVQAIAGAHTVAEVTFDTAKPDLITVVRERMLLDVPAELEGEMKEPRRELKDMLVFEPLSRWFVKAIVIDYPTHMAIVNRYQGKVWGKSDQDLLAIGMENLRSNCPPKFGRVDGFFVGLWDDDYDSSRVLVPELFGVLPIRGRAVVCLPNRSTLLIADEADNAGVASMIAKAQEIVHTKPQSQNPAPLVVNRDGSIEDFNVPPTSPLSPLVKRAQNIAAASAYDEQKRRLEERYRRMGKDIFVASCSLFENRLQHESMTLAVWAKGIPTLLPIVDWVAFIDAESPTPAMLKAKWEDVRSVLGDKMLDIRVFPERFYISDFPTKDQLKAMKAT